MTTQRAVGQRLRVEFEGQMIGVESRGSQCYEGRERTLTHELVQDFDASFFKVTG